jgi:uroporphyrinogen decarboxylase
MDRISHRERIRRAFAGERVDRVPISLWRHFGGIDMTADGLTEAMVQWQATYDFDFLKFMPTGTYPIIDWGAETIWEPLARGIRTVTKYPVSAPRDWESLAPLDVERGILGMVNSALRQTVRAVGPELPVLQTIFSPMTVAAKLATPAVAIAHSRQNRASFERGLETIADVTERMITAAVAAGADIFYVSQAGTADVFGREELALWETPYARRLLTPVVEQVLVVTHTHGDHLWFEDLLEWPGHAINWHDRQGGPSLAEARRLTGKGLVGGIRGYGFLRNGSRVQLLEEISEAIAQVDCGLVVAPGCVVPMDCPPHLLEAARTAVDDSRVTTPA